MFGVMVVDVVVVPSLLVTPMLPLGRSSLFPDSTSLADANLLEAVAPEPEDCPCAASSAFIVSGEMLLPGGLYRKPGAAESAEVDLSARSKEFPAKQTPCQQGN
jgi:hypothetical protein